MVAVVMCGLRPPSLAAASLSLFFLSLCSLSFFFTVSVLLAAVYVCGFIEEEGDMEVWEA